jgi:multiple sugar transport system substrate-binding protein
MEGNNIVVPLDDLISDARYGLGGSDVRFDSVKSSEMVSEFLDEGKILGEQYLMPLMRSSEVCYINLDLVKALGFEIPEEGLTWNFIFSVCEKAMEPVRFDEKGNPVYINGQSIMVPFIYKSTDNMMIQMLKQKGYGYSNENGEILLFSDDTKELLYLIADKVDNKLFSTFDIENKYPGDLINAGQCIFGVDSTAGATWIGSDSPNVEINSDSIKKFELLVTEIPQFDPENPQMISQGPSMCIFNKQDSGEVLASWLFMQFLLTNQVQIPYAMTEGYVPVTYRAQQDARYVDYLSREGQLDENGSNSTYYAPKIAAAKILLENIENTFITPVFTRSASLRNAAGFLIEETGKGVRRGKTIDDKFFESLYSRTRTLQKLDAVDEEESTNKIDQEPLPLGSVALITGLAVVWVGLGAYLLLDHMKKGKGRN